ncbi:hypothetical protein Esti_005319 [Eimeria stiedai]
MEGLSGLRATGHPAPHVSGSESEDSSGLLFAQGSQEQSACLVDPFCGTIPPARRASFGEVHDDQLAATEDESSVNEHASVPVITHEAPLTAAAQVDGRSTSEGFGAASIFSGKQGSMVHGPNGAGQQHAGFSRQNSQREVRGTVSPISIEVDKGRDEQQAELEKTVEVCCNPSRLPGGNSNHSWGKLSTNNRADAPQLAEEAFARIKIWREVFSALTGMHGVYVLANFAFDNPSGGICSLFCFLCSAFAQLDRRAPSYFLTAMLSFCLGMVVAVSLSTPVRGFEVFLENDLLRRICVTQLGLLFVHTLVAVIIALRINKLHRFLREPGVLVPVQQLEARGGEASPPTEAKKQNAHRTQAGRSAEAMQTRVSMMGGIIRHALATCRLSSGLLQFYRHTSTRPLVRDCSQVADLCTFLSLHAMAYYFYMLCPSRCISA